MKHYLLENFVFKSLIVNIIDSHALFVIDILYMYA